MCIIYHLLCKNKESKNLYLCFFGIYKETEKRHKNLITMILIVGGGEWTEEQAGNERDFSLCTSLYLYIYYLLEN